MKHRWLWLLIVPALCFMGCQPNKEDTWLLVSFEKDVPMTYKMVSERTTEIDLTTGNPNKKSRPQITTEKLELVMTYTPVDVDLFGLTTVKATCTSARVTRSSFSGKKDERDAMETLPGKSFILKLSPTGEIADYSDLERVARELGKAAFAEQNGGQNIKNPDMIYDFIAMQRFLWDSTATVSDPLHLKAGQTWKAKQLVPWPVPLNQPPARTTTYTLDSITDEPDQPRKALIKSTYALSDEPMKDFVQPYEETRFQMRGLFGFLRNYQFKSLEGAGSQVFNMDKGLIESDQQHYTLHVTAAFMLPLGDSLPVLTVDQKISFEHIETP
ncbi:MAG: hypothetical protein L0Y36_07900 [Planctomycetales bacterium]|nr:hypothetical protein [Planctomycetales bacterium]